jgi:transcriptional regulator with XRE-family HTH domain
VSDAAVLLVEARRAARFTQRDLAAAAATPQPAIARIESGAVSPRSETLERLLRACGRELVTSPATGEVDPQDWAQVLDLLQHSPAERLRNVERAARSITKLRTARRRRR